MPRQYTPRVPHECPHCGLVFLRPPSEPNTFCSRKCVQAARTRPAAERFWEKVRKTEGCWLWTAARNNKGYGQFGTGSEQCLAHRFSWELQHGPITDGLFVLHHCDTPLCVRPAHLFLGDYKANMADCARKGRSAKGSRSGSISRPERLKRGSAASWSKLSEEQVREIRRRAETGEVQQALADEYGVTQSNINLIVQRKSWRHVG